jgi:ATP-dependent Clp protease, protease subunit
MKNKGNKTGEIWLYGTIGESFWGDGVSANQFRKDLAALGDVSSIDLRINSDGGVVTEARAMYNLLVQHKATINVHIDGIAASAASFLAMAGDTISIAEGGFFMIHNARGFAMGEAKDFEHMAEVLRTVNATITDTYVARTGIKRADITKWMDAETWFTGKEAVAKGFATEVVDNMAVAACVDPTHTWLNQAKLPKELRPNRVAAMKMVAQARQ